MITKTLIKSVYFQCNTAKKYLFSNNSVLIYIYIHVSHNYSKFVIRIIQVYNTKYISFQGKSKNVCILLAVNVLSDTLF